MEDISCKKCGLINDYKIEKRGVHDSAFCNNCGSWIKHLPQKFDPKKEFILPFGKYKGEPLSMMVSDEERRYLQWIIQQDWVKPNILEKIKKHLETF